MAAVTLSTVGSEWPSRQAFGGQHGDTDAYASFADSEPTYLSRTGRAPTNDEVVEYLERYKLQGFLTDVIMYVARYMPIDPFGFLLDHMEALVDKHRARHDLVESPPPKLRPLFGSPVTEALQHACFEQSPERRSKVVRHLATALQSEDLAGASAAKLFEQYAVQCGDARVMSEEQFRELAGRLESSWGIQPGDVQLMLQTLQRWRFRKNATSNSHGFGIWPMQKEEFVEAFPRVLRQVRDHYVPIGGKLHRALFIKRVPGLLTDRYVVGSKLGRGAFGEVFIVRLKADLAERRVCKRVNRSRQLVPCEELHSEVELLRALDHPHIIRLFEYFETTEWLDMIMEPVFGGTLARLLESLYRDSDGNLVDARPDSLSEGWVAIAMSQLLSALAYAHDVVGVIHKDIKPDNVLLVGTPGASPVEQLREPLHVMLADFGIAELFADGPQFMLDDEPISALSPSLGSGGGAVSSGSCGGCGGSTEGPRRELRSSRVGGTPPYMSPEMFMGSFTEKSDIWSLGVIMFQVMLGELPYRADNILMQANLVCNPRRHPPWHRLAKRRWSLGARWFCQQMLLKDEQQRPSAASAAQDLWLSKAAADHDTEPPTEEERSSLHHQHLQSHLMKMAMFAVTSQMNLSNLHHLNLRFKHFDTSGDGRLSHEEMLQVLRDVKIPLGEDPELIIEALDGDRSGYIEYSEFISGCLNLASEGMREHLRDAFEVFDLDGSGWLTFDELSQVLTEGPNSKPSCGRTARGSPDHGGPQANARPSVLLPDGSTVEEVMRALDTDGTGKVSFEEFEAYLLCEHEKVGHELHRTQVLLMQDPGGLFG